MSKRRHNFGTKRFKEKSLFIFHARITLKSLILLFVRLIARGGRYEWTHTHTYTQDNYSNPHCACEPRVNKYCNLRACAPRVNYIYTHSNYTQHLYINLCKVKSMDDNCGEWVECMGVASGCGEQEVGVASGSGWNLWVWLLGVVLRRYIDFLIILIPTPLVCVLFCSSIPTFLLIFYIYIVRD